MRVLFVGEGPHDIGRIASYDGTSAPTEGVVQTLARKVCPAIDPTSPTVRWVDLGRFPRDRVRRGYPGKVAAAVLLSERRYGCQGTVMVVDADRRPGRREELEQGIQGTTAVHPVVHGVAVESIEAWTLGAPEAIAAELAVAVSAVRDKYPSLHVEALAESSGKSVHRPKPLLAAVANLGDRKDDVGFRCSVAARTDVVALEKACPQGFAAFARALRAAFGTVPAR